MPSDVISIAGSIEGVIEAIKVEGQKSPPLIQAEAETARDYDKAVAIAGLAHKAAGMAVGLIEKQCKGDAAEQLFDKIVAEKTLKAHWQRLSYLQAQLNAYQSIFRHLSHT